MGDCARCTKPTTRLALDGGAWVCAKCARPAECRACGRLVRAIGVERCAIGSMDSDEYALPQCLVYQCNAQDDRHPTYGSRLTWGPEHRGPGWQEPRFVKDSS